MKNSEQPIYPQSENWQNDMEKHTTNPDKYGHPSMDGIGLTKREYFAAAALQGFCANQNLLTKAVAEPKLVADACLEIADALLTQLEHGTK